MAEPADDNPQPNASQPLLPQDDASSPGTGSRGGGDRAAHPSPHQQRQRKARELLSTRRKHFLIMGLVALDVVAILADVFVALVACDMDKENEDWVEKTRDGLKAAGLVFSSMFLVELLLSLWAFGFAFFASWFHIFDAFVILTSFIVDLLAHGIAEEIGSLVIILRLWRFVKIVDEMSLGASERSEEIESRIVLLENQNSELKDCIEALKSKLGKSDPAS